jgi:antitoxin component YwqK of YwqJK toxin-antitoxin module
VTDYLKTGELWFVGKAISSDVRCFKLDGYEGQATYYYRENSKILRQESWQDGKKHGVQITYDKGGNEILREEYVKGEKIDTSKFSVSAENPIIGTWKYVECTNNDCTEFKGYEALGGKSLPATIVRTSTYIYFQNGVVESVHETMLGTSKVKGNWKYTSKNDSSGVLEEFLGSDLVERGNVKFLSRNQLEYTITFSKNTDSIGKQYVWARQ